MSNKLQDRCKRWLAVWFGDKGHVYSFRSAITGRFVSKAYAKRYPQNTVGHRVR